MLMRPCRTKAPGWRAIVAVFALYAFLLQPFLGAMARGTGPTAAGYLCSSDETGAPAHGGTAIHDHQCCTAAQLIGPALSQVGDGVTIVWPARQVSALSWRPEAERPKTGPPTRAHAPRGPPSA